MANNANKTVDLSQAIVDFLFGAGQAQNGAALIQATGQDKQLVAAAVKDLIQAGFVVQDGKLFDLAPQFKGQAEEAQAEDNGDLEIEYDEAPAPVAQNRVATKAPAKAAVAPRPAAKAAVAQPKVAAKAPAKVAQKAAPKAQAEDNGFTMSFNRLDSLNADELAERLEVARSAAQANFETGNRDNQLVAEVLMRWVNKTARRYNKMTNGAE